MQEVDSSLFAGKTAFDEAVKPEMPAAPQALAPQTAVEPEVSAAPQASATQSAFGAANEAGTGPDFGASNSQVRCTMIYCLQMCFRRLLQIGNLVSCSLCCMTLPCTIAKTLGLMTPDMVFSCWHVC